MDSSLLNKLTAAIEFGRDILQNPQDLAYWPVWNAIAVADDSNGLLVFSSDGKTLLHHIRKCADAGSVCYDRQRKFLIVSVSRAISQGDTTPGELHFYADEEVGGSSEKSLKIIRTVQIPVEPRVRVGYVRWVCVDHTNEADVWIAAGDNEQAALWRYSFENDAWLNVWRGDGDLEHPSFLPMLDNSSNPKLEMIVVRWTSKSDENWIVQRWTIDRRSGEILEQNRLGYNDKDVAEPWTAVADSINGTVYVYDYRSGAILTLAPPPTYNRPTDPIGMIKCGQWAGLDTNEGYVYVSGSDERCVRVFAKTRI